MAKNGSPMRRLSWPAGKNLGYEVGNAFPICWMGESQRGARRLLRLPRSDQAPSAAQCPNLWVLVESSLPGGARKTNVPDLALPQAEDGQVGVLKDLAIITRGSLSLSAHPFSSFTQMKAHASWVLLSFFLSISRSAPSCCCIFFHRLELLLVQLGRRILCRSRRAQFQPTRPHHRSSFSSLVG